MEYRRVLVIGGSGFIGASLAARLVATNREVIVPTRRPLRAAHLRPLPTVEIRAADIHDDRELDALVAGSDAVVNLVGILHGSSAEPFGAEFALAHVTLPGRIAAACARHGVRRFIHISALGVADDGHSGPSMYLRSKAAGEQAVRATVGIDWTILRPSVIFGPQDKLMNTFATLQRFAPVVPLARAETRLQPVYVGDVARAIVACLENRATIAHCYELAGPHVFTLAELFGLAGHWAGRTAPVLALPDPLGWLQAATLEFAPGPTIMSRDNFDSLAIDNVASGPMAPELGIEPTPLAAIVPGYLARSARG